ncbi:hypothetical protein [Rhizobium paranaense]|uniref:Uncharacterized protein n=1 Tax=Rhizobium paranaense TaxID=1650438 RepID=A0A7W9D335_9HYPH|nr:hypothetical protein [Rhizobium paranaense]MBB5575957.1 hypothetical protein [Rhizobium paranaense]
MADEYALHTIRSDQVVRAFTLLRNVTPTLTIDQWQSLVDGERWHIVVATDTACYVRGLTVSSTGKHPVAGKLLDVPVLVVGSAVDDVNIADHLFTEAKRRAIVSKCQFIRIWMPAPDVFEHLRDLTHYNKWDHGLMCPIDIAPAADLT